MGLLSEESMICVPVPEPIKIQKAAHISNNELESLLEAKKYKIKRNDLRGAFDERIRNFISTADMIDTFGSVESLEEGLKKFLNIDIKQMKMVVSRTYGWDTSRDSIKLTIYRPKTKQPHNPVEVFTITWVIALKDDLTLWRNIETEINTHYRECQ